MPIIANLFPTLFPFLHSLLLSNLELIISWTCNKYFHSYNLTLWNISSSLFDDFCIYKFRPENIQMPLLLQKLPSFFPLEIIACSSEHLNIFIYALLWYLSQYICIYL